jgi:hypothetical protein
MKVPIDEVAVVNLDAPVLPATSCGLVWCKHCQVWHEPGPAEGHRESHCHDASSPHWRNGYNLAYAMTECIAGATDPACARVRCSRRRRPC